MQLVCFGDEVEKTNFGDVIVVNNATGNDDQVEDNPKRGILKMLAIVLSRLYLLIFVFIRRVFSILFDMSCLIVRKWLYVSKIVSTLKRRDSSFRKSLGWAFEQLPVCFCYINLHE